MQSVQQLPGHLLQLLKMAESLLEGERMKWTQAERTGMKKAGKGDNAHLQKVAGDKRKNQSQLSIARNGEDAAQGRSVYYLKLTAYVTRKTF